MISGAPLSVLPLSSAGASISVEIDAALDVVLEDCALISAATQVGDGALALFDATIEDCELNADASVAVASGLDATIEDCVLSGLGVVGSLGPFTRRPFLVLN